MLILQLPRNHGDFQKTGFPKEAARGAKKTHCFNTKSRRGPLQTLNSWFGIIQLLNSQMICLEMYRTLKTDSPEGAIMDPWNKAFQKV